MKALVLAAGKGERLRPLTETIPKPMLELGGRPLIHYPLMMLKRAGITQVAVNVYHLAGIIESGLGSGRDTRIGDHLRARDDAAGNRRPAARDCAASSAPSLSSSPTRTP